MVPQQYNKHLLIEEINRSTHHYYVYRVAREKNSVFYVGVTNDLLHRAYEHKMELLEGFTKKYHIKMLVYYDCFEDIHDAISRENYKKMEKGERSFHCVIPAKAGIHFDIQLNLS